MLEWFVLHTIAAQGDEKTIRQKIKELQDALSH